MGIAAEHGTRRIGRIPVTLAGLGCNNFGRRIDEQQARRVVDAALEAGVRVFDTADVYGEGRSEEYLGRALETRRDQAVVISKFGWRAPEAPPGGYARWVAEACDASLRRLGTDHIDVYLLHRPHEGIPLADTVAAMNHLVDQGKVREIGCSNFTEALLDEAASAADAVRLRRFATVENDHSLLRRAAETEVLPACERLGTSFIPYSPLASGALSGKYRRGRPVPSRTRLGDAGQMGEEVLGEERMAAVERLDAYARAHGHGLLDLAMSWLASRPVVATVIAGATTPEQVRANAAALVAWPLSPDELREVDALTTPR